MSQDPNSSGGAPQGSGGITEIENPDNIAKPDVVKYETHEKLLREKKKRDEENSELKKRLEAFEKENKDKEEKELLEKENFKKLLEIREKEKKDLEEKYSGLQTSLQNGSKLRSFFDNVPGKIDEQYWDLIDVSKIAINPETGAPDEASAKAYAEEFQKKYALVIRTGSSAKMPNDAPNSVTKLTYEEWLKLPPKEMAAKMKDIIE